MDGRSKELDSTLVDTLCYFDMKHVFYLELFSSMIIPWAFGYVLVRFVRVLDKSRLLHAKTVWNSGYIQDQIRRHL